MIRGGDGFARTLMYGDREKAAAHLRIGDVVERHMMDDGLLDIILHYIIFEKYKHFYIYLYSLFF